MKFQVRTYCRVVADLVAINDDGREEVWMRGQPEDQVRQTAKACEQLQLQGPIPPIARGPVAQAAAKVLGFVAGRRA